MTEPAGVNRSSKRDDEADRLWIARAIASPDAWRLRATNSAGLLSAAAAASVAGLLLRDGPTSGSLRQSALVAAAAYVMAVLAYLVAGVWPSPKKDMETLTLADDIWDYCVKEARPIKWAAWIGTIAAVVAIAATGVTLVRAVDDGSDKERSAEIAIAQADALKAAQTLCPTLKQPFSARVVLLDSTRLRARLPADACAKGETDLVLRRDDVVLRFDT